MSSGGNSVFNPWSGWEDDAEEESPPSMENTEPKLSAEEAGRPDRNFDSAQVAADTVYGTLPVDSAPEPIATTLPSMPAATPAKGPSAPATDVAPTEMEDTGRTSQELEDRLKALKGIPDEKSTFDPEEKNNLVRIQELEKELARMNEQLERSRSLAPAGEPPPPGIEEESKPSVPKPAANDLLPADTPKISGIFRKPK